MTKHHTHDAVFKPESIHELRAMVQGIHKSLIHTIQERAEAHEDGIRRSGIYAPDHMAFQLSARRDAFKDALALIDLTIEAQQANAKRSPMRTLLIKWLNLG